MNFIEQIAVGFLIGVVLAVAVAITIQGAG